MTASPISDIRVLASGDTALTVEFGDCIDRALSLRVIALARRLERRNVEGVVETVPTFRSLMVHYDPDRVDAGALEASLRELAVDLTEEAHSGRSWTIPACFDPALAPDLDEVATRTGLTATDVVECLTAETYYVYMVGFLPGYPYMGDVPEPLVLPRRENPRLRVPPGSVGIARTMAAIYPIESPGGWHLIGRTPVRIFDTSCARPALLAPGDQVRFTPVPLDAHERLERAVAAGAHRLTPDEAAP